MMGSSPQAVERVNRYVLTAVQALLGLIAPSIQAIALQVLDDELTLWFWIQGDPAEIEQDIEDAVVDMDSFLQPEDILITSRVEISAPPLDVHSWARMIYRAKIIE